MGILKLAYFGVFPVISGHKRFTGFLATAKNALICDDSFKNPFERQTKEFNINAT